MFNPPSRASRSLWGLCCALLMGCASNPDSPGPGAIGNPAAVPPAADGMADPGPAAGPELADAGTPTSEPPPPPPRMADACGAELDADYGAVRPDFGLVVNGEPFEGDPLAPGPFAVRTEVVSVRHPDPERADIPVTLYAPETPPGQALPLVMVLPGFGKGFGVTLSGTHPTYAFFSEHLASHGFAVAGMDFVAGGSAVVLGTPELGAHFLVEQPENVREVRAVLDWVLAESPARERLDASKVAIAGHSQGGKIAFWTAVEDARIDLVIGWDPQNAAGGVPCAGAPDSCNDHPIAPVCPDPAEPSAGASGRMHEIHAETLVFAARDANTMIDVHQHAEHFYRGAPSPAHLLLFPDARHEDWSDGDNPVAQATMRVQLALLLTRFKGATGLEDYLPSGSAFASDGLAIQQRSK